MFPDFESIASRANDVPSRAELAKTHMQLTMACAGIVTAWLNRNECPDPHHAQRFMRDTYSTLFNLPNTLVAPAAAEPAMSVPAAESAPEPAPMPAPGPVSGWTLAAGIATPPTIEEPDLPPVQTPEPVASEPDPNGQQASDHKSPDEIAASIHYDGLVSFIDGKKYQLIGRHIAKHGHTIETYRGRYGLPADYPSTCQAYRDARAATPTGAVGADAGQSEGSAKPEDEAEAGTEAPVEPVSGAEAPATTLETAPAVDVPATDPVADVQAETSPTSDAPAAAGDLDVTPERKPLQDPAMPAFSTTPRQVDLEEAIAEANRADAEAQARRNPPLAEVDKAWQDAAPSITANPEDRVEPEAPAQPKAAGTAFNTADMLPNG